MTDQPATHLSRAEVAADHVTAAARRAITGDPRNVAVHQTATGAARAATARTAAATAGNRDWDDPEELEAAHLLIAELAVRLAEAEQR